MSPWSRECYHIQDMVVVCARGPDWISDNFNTDH